jgi:SAM-dependent methyltransferase
VDQAGLYEHWRQIHESRQRDFRATALNALIADVLDPSEDVLDMGCGTGGFVLDMLERGQRVRGLDSSEEMLAMGRRLLTENGFSPDHLVQGQLTEYLNESTDPVTQAVCLDVIEHIEDDERAVGQLHSLLEPGGRLVLTVPAIPGLYGEKDRKVGHYRRYSPAMLRDLFPDDQWEIEALRYWNLVGVPVTWFAVKVQKRAVDESVRSGQGAVARTVSGLLRWWFLVVENRIRPPLGLTLVLHARRQVASGS